MSLDPIDPDTAVELYLADRESEVSQATLYPHSSRLGQFVRVRRTEPYQFERTDWSAAPRVSTVAAARR